MKIQKLILESSGYIGASLLLIAYFCVSFNILTSQSVVFQLLNVVGSAGNVIYYFYKKAYSGAILDSFWLIVALLAVTRLLV
jgi:hypothetical protein